MKKGYFWLSYDLGLKGDYEGMFTWLDNHGAKECVNSVAFIDNYQYAEDLSLEVWKDLNKSVTFKNSDRVYIIRANKEGKFQGIFLLGQRRNEAPWTGFGTSGKQETFDGDAPL